MSELKSAMDAGVDAGMATAERLRSREMAHKFSDEYFAMAVSQDAAKAALRATDTRIAELEAEVERLKAGPKVKPLEWFMPHGAKTMRIAETVLGKYRVWTHSEAGGSWFWDVSALGVAAATIETGSAHSCESAKAAAQADYEARIMSALVQP